MIKLPFSKKKNELLNEDSSRNRKNKDISGYNSKHINEKIAVIINIIKILKGIVKTPETDILHSSFNTKEDVLNELNTHIQKLMKEDFSKIEGLIILFAPTSDLQEISIASGWGKQFLSIAERFDGAIKDLIEEFNLKPFSNS